MTPTFRSSPLWLRPAAVPPDGRMMRIACQQQEREETVIHDVFQMERSGRMFAGPRAATAQNIAVKGKTVHDGGEARSPMVSSSSRTTIAAVGKAAKSNCRTA